MTISKPKIFKLHKSKFLSPGIHTIERDYYHNVQLLSDFELTIDGEVWLVKSTIPRLQTLNRFVMLPLTIEFWECVTNNNNALLNWVNLNFNYTLSVSLYKKEIRLKQLNSNQSYVLYGCQVSEHRTTFDDDMEPVVEATIMFDYFMNNIIL